MGQLYGRNERWSWWRRRDPEKMFLKDIEEVKAVVIEMLELIFRVMKSLSVVFVCNDNNLKTLLFRSNLGLFWVE